MADLVSEWLAANYPQHNLNDATRLRLLELVGSQYSYLAVPDLWRVYMEGQGYTGALADQFAQMYSDKNVDITLRNPFYAITDAGVGFNIASIFAGGFLGGAYDFQEVYQDSARTTVANVGDPVGSITDVSGNALNISQATAGSRPILRVDAGGNRYLEGDGVDDFMSVPLALSAYPVTIGLAAQDNTSPLSSALVTFGGTDTNYHTVIFSSATNVIAQSRNTASVGTGGASIATKAVVVSQHDGSFVSAWRNGVGITPVANATAYGSTSTLYVLRLRPAGGYAKAFLYPFFAIQKALPASERQSAERWLALHSGVTL